jgi:hypothetical protein
MTQQQAERLIVAIEGAGAAITVALTCLAFVTIIF